MSGDDFIYKRSPERQAVHDALLAKIRRQRDQLHRLDRLCERLGIRIDGDESERLADEWNTWAKVGQVLAADQPEFGRGRGRPRLADPSVGKDVQRAQIVVDLATSLHREFDLPPQSRTWWLETIKENVAKLPAISDQKRLFGQNVSTLRNSIIRGLKQIECPQGLFTKK